jgi:hypothetical protein
MIHGLHEAFIALGAFTILSTLVFSRLRRGDGDSETARVETPVG